MRVVAIATFLSLGNLVFGQSSASSTNLMIVLGFTFVVALLVLGVALMMLKLLRTITREQAIKRAEEEGREYVEEPGLWTKLDQQVFTQAVAIEEEASIELDHDYDGIKELDNHLPPWWKYMFYLTIVFAVVYVILYHFTGSLPLQAQEYENAVALAEAEKAKKASTEEAADIDENNVVFSDDPAVLANGAKVFKINCVACHKENGEGGIGPNLTDEYWINEGGSIQHIFKAVKYGFPTKGMIAWEPVLSPQKISDVASYVKSLQGTNPPNAKAPQGELYVEEATAEEATVEADSIAVE